MSLPTVALMRTIPRAISPPQAKESHVMAKVKQVTVALENRPGTLAHVAKVLADARVNVLALLGSTNEMPARRKSTS
jgi:ACT domain-containing protein